MNYIWCAMILVSFAAAAVNGRMEETAAAVFEGAASSVTVLLSFAGAMCFWTGILKIAEKSGASGKLEKLLSPLIKKLFPDAGEKARGYIAMNLSANILGMGNAATPMGIKAMECLDEENNKSKTASAAMCMLVALNTTSFQLIPSTVISLRTAAGSANPAAVIVPIWIASLTAVTLTAVITKAVCRR